MTAGPDRFTTVFPTAYQPLGSCTLKQSAEDFIVNEILSFPFSDQGEHAYLRVRKIGENTNWVVRLLAKHFQVKERDIGYAGLKDRHAITTQWFSLPLGEITQQQIGSFNSDTIQIVEQARHSGKLRKGAIKHNEFILTLREVAVAEQELQQRIRLIRNKGVPNYFDEQRFGHARQNLLAADDLLSGRSKVKKHKRGIYLSAARSWLFNLILAERVAQQCWSSGLDGDVFMLDGSRKYFQSTSIDTTIQQRLLELDIHPTGPLYGKGKLETEGRAAELELAVLREWPGWDAGLCKAGVSMQRRSTRVVPVDLQYQYDNAAHIVTLSFSLPAGAYATNLVREIFTQRITPA